MVIAVVVGEVRGEIVWPGEVGLFPADNEYLDPSFTFVVDEIHTGPAATLTAVLEVVSDDVGKREYLGHDVIAIP